LGNRIWQVHGSDQITRHFLHGKVITQINTFMEKQMPYEAALKEPDIDVWDSSSLAQLIIKKPPTSLPGVLGVPKSLR